MHIKIYLESLGIERPDLLVLFRPPARPNIFLQTRPANLARLADPDKAVSFLLPFMCDKKELKVQLFARTREQANLLCKLFWMNIESSCSCSFQGEFFREEAARLNCPTFTPVMVQVKSPNSLWLSHQALTVFIFRNSLE